MFRIIFSLIVITLSFYLSGCSQMKLTINDYADGSGNVYFLKKTDKWQITYSPVQPINSSTGTYSGGDPYIADITDSDYEEIKALIVKAIENQTIHIENRVKLSGVISITTETGEQSYILRPNSSELKAIDTWFKASKVRGKIIENPFPPEPKVKPNPLDIGPVSNIAPVSNIGETNDLGNISQSSSPFPETIKRLFKNDEIEVTFPEDGFASQKIEKEKGEKYLSQYSTYLKFCKQPEQPPYVQQVYSADGWLCAFYILPPWDVDKIKQDLLSGLDKYDQIRYQEQETIGEEIINGNKVLVWRHRRGKTRLDKFLVLGKKHHYLFVSSPYGDGDKIRQIVETVKLF